MNASFWQQKKILVTGGGGFVGRWLGRGIAGRGAELQIVDLCKPGNFEIPFAYRQVDLRDLTATRAMLGELRPDVVIHLAGLPGVGESHQSPVKAYEANVTVTFNMLEACRHYQELQSIVAVSSNHVYGEHHPMPTAEDAALRGHGMYAVSKACGDLLAQAYGKTYGVPVGIARMTNSYGGDDHHVNHIVTSTILSVLRNEPPVINRSGRDRKGYLYIEDTVDGLLAIAEGVARTSELRGEAFNIVPDQAVTVLELVDWINAAVGTNLKPVVKHPDAEAEEEYLDNTKARERLGWRPRYDYAAGLVKTVKWYREHPPSGVA